MLSVSAGTPFLVADINPGATSSNPHDLVAVDGQTYFIADDGLNNRALWRSDGTDTGTEKITRYVNDLTNVNGTLFFSPGNAELWKIDDSGTSLVKDFGPGNVIPNQLTDVGGTLFFVGSDWSSKKSGPGVELWKSDGTARGTKLVKDIYTGTTRDCYRDEDTRRRVCSSWVNSSLPADLINVNDTLFFTADDGTGRALWKSSGGKGGTQMVKDIPASRLANVNGTLFFTYGGQRWISDGTSAGTVPLKDFVLGLTGNLNLGGTRIFPADDGIHGWELWKSDGTAAGTVLIKDINPGSRSSGRGPIVNVNGTFFFSANDGANDLELWKSDGTTAGTVLVADINPSGYSWPRNLTDGNGLLVFFSADDGTKGRELWQSDGTKDGTKLVHDINPDGASSYPRWLTMAGENLFFTANDGKKGAELWDPPIIASPGDQNTLDNSPGSFDLSESTQSSSYAFDVALFSLESLTNDRDTTSPATDSEVELITLQNVEAVAVPAHPLNETYKDFFHDDDDAPAIAQGGESSVDDLFADFFGNLSDDLLIV